MLWPGRRWCPSEAACAVDAMADLVGVGSAGPGGHVEEDGWGGAREEDARAEGQCADDVGREDGESPGACGYGAAAVGAAAPVADLLVTFPADCCQVLEVAGL